MAAKLKRQISTETKEYYIRSAFFNMLIIHVYNTRYTANQNLYKLNVQTNVGKQLISFMVTDIWKELPLSIQKKKVLKSVPVFPKQIIRYFLSSKQEMI